MTYRTHHCNELRITHAGLTVTLSGWVDSRRDHGGVIFADLRDKHGITQIVFRPEEFPHAATTAHNLRPEDVIRVSGTVTPRLQGTENPKLPTGEIEIVAHTLEILNPSDVLPFPLDATSLNEDLRLEFRFLDLRRKPMQNILTTRHRILKATRDFFDSQDFLEIETPILSKSTPEGAREFLVPSRLLPGKFYALSQSPQQYKQLLMVAGIEKYFQIARCFRDEDPRSDRITELTQIDVEASFIRPDDIFRLVEGLLQSIFRAALQIEIPTPFDRITYHDAINRFGSDKPDRRFASELIDLSDIFQNSSFKVFRSAVDSGGVVKAINAKGFASITTGQIQSLTDLAIRSGAKGLAFIKIENGEWKSPIVKFLSEHEKSLMASRLAIEEGDLILFAAGPWLSACSTLGRIRLEIASLRNLIPPYPAFDFLWVVDFPLLEWSPENQKWNAVHHPFTRPHQDDLHLLETQDQLHKIRAEAYDVVLNGVEIGGGSIRIHERPLQEKIFQILGITPEKQNRLFPHLLKAFRFGAPPHGGVALGLDRLLMLICNTNNIRDVVAFPKTSRGEDLMMSSPTSPDPAQLRELSLQIRQT